MTIAEGMGEECKMFTAMRVKSGRKRLPKKKCWPRSCSTRALRYRIMFYLCTYFSKRTVEAYNVIYYTLNILHAARSRRRAN